MSEPRPSSHVASTDPIFVAASLSLLGLVATVLPLRNWDYWFHITVGRLLDVYHAIPAKNVFGFSAPPSTPVFLHTWIGDYWLFRLHEAGGLVVTLLTRDLCALTALGLLAWSTYQLSNRHGVATAAITFLGGLTFFAIAGFAGPQMFVWPVFAALAAIFVAARSWQKRLWLLPIVTAIATGFWVNAAPNFWAPVLLSAAFAAVAQFEGAPTRRNWHMAACVAAIAMMFVTPLGSRIFLALLNGTGSETWLVLAAPLALAPIIGNAPRFERKIARGLQVLVLFVLAGATLAVLPWSDAHRAIPAHVFGDSVRQADPLYGVGPSNTPVEAVELLKSWGSQPRVYAASHLSGYLLFELQDPSAPSRIVWPLPDWTPTKDVAEMERAMAADPEVFRGVFKQMGVNAVLVTPELGKIGEYVVSAPDWVKLGEWPSGTLYVPE